MALPAQGDPAPWGDQLNAEILSIKDTADAAETPAGAQQKADAAQAACRPLSYVPTYSEVTGKPSTFTPASHTHPATEISNSTTIGRSLVTAADALAGRTAISAAQDTHTHVQGDVTGLSDALTSKADLTLTKNTITGTSYTLVAGDAVNIQLHTTSGSGVTITVPQDSDASIAQEISIPWRQYGAGQITFAEGTGATLVSRGDVNKSAGQYATGTLTKTGANTWLLDGDITA